MSGQCKATCPLGQCELEEMHEDEHWNKNWQKTAVELTTITLARAEVKKFITWWNAQYRTNEPEILDLLHKWRIMLQVGANYLVWTEPTE